LKNVKEWLFNKINKKPTDYTLHPLQKGCPDIIPNLRAFPFWNREEFPWLSKIEENFETIKREVIGLKGH
jgi:aspartate beta-hydroxylase